ncbi:MAG: hypothetical protein O7F71_22060 [Gammaproteobacteria bacterium]|nr:hypothetical protein [Gammaproteobacteria bacterium]
MKVWLPYIRGGSGTDVFTNNLARALEGRGLDVEVTEFPHKYQFVPFALSRIPGRVGAISHGSATDIGCLVLA